MTKMFFTPQTNFRRPFWHRGHRFWKIVQTAHDPPESLPTIAQNHRPRSFRMTAHDGPEYAAMPAPDRQMIVCEGWATASSLARLSPGAVVIAACDAGNLLHVALEARKRSPRIDLVIAADADEIGMAKAKFAAVAASAKWIWPRFPKDAPKGLSDFNDWIVWRRSQRMDDSHVG
ncbi:toprim domain-containing protein [Acidithiobacillus thiooxidans]|uniref:toprim domain-containing protein n=1 Tax=Acidithiobacillus thiooxidans TaxID=930 RepID=UPI0029C2602E|nr:toprim domain-containing protein [Acidithiobacillus thiooxidans]MDX5936444.1 toprim domain-containing protein [Acidithiobacillus thiooxidans]